MKTQPSVAIVGAGMSGLTCATALKGLIDRVTVFDRNVFPGGRVSRFRAGDLEFNHGAQYFTVSNPLFWNIVSAWQTDGIVRPWNGWIVELNNGQIVNSDMSVQRYVGVPRMQVVAENLARHCQILTSTNITEMERREDGRWCLFSERGDYQGSFDIVIIATAAHQVSSLCANVPAIARLADNVNMTACWSGMFAFDKRLNVPYDAAHVLNSPVSWISRYQYSEAPAKSDCWVVHASPEWSQQHVASFRGRVMSALLDAFWDAIDLDQQPPSFSSVHCWKYAQPINPINQDSVFVEDQALGACGDWCTAPRVEGAVLSGFSMADRVMKFVNKQQ